MAEAIRVIVLTARMTKIFAQQALLETKYKRGEDWVVVDSEAEVDGLIVRGKPQLIVTDGKLKFTVLVMKLRRNNPALKAGCISIGVGRNPGEYQYRARQSNCRDFRGLVEMIAHYLEFINPKSPVA